MRYAFDFMFAMGALSVAITLAAYIVLLRQIVWGQKRPSPIAWIGFGFCTGVGYLVQFFAGVHAGSWTMGVTAFFCFIVGGASMLKGARKAERLDWIAFALGLVTFIGWLICYVYQFDQTLAAVLATASDLLLYIPLIRAGWSHPELDSRMAYFLNTIKFVPAIIVTVPFTIATVLYPIALVVANSGMNIYLVLRKVYLGARRKEFQDLWRVLDAEFPFASSMAIAVIYAFTVWVDMNPLFRLFNTFAAAGAISIATCTLLSAIGCPHQERIDRGEPGLMSAELNRLWVRAYKVVWLTSWLDMQIFMVLFVPIFVGRSDPGIEAPFLLLMGFMILCFLGMTTLIVAHGEFKGNIWKWLPQKLCSQIALIAGAYADFFWGHGTAIAIFLSIVLAQLVWTVRTWPHQLAEPQDPDRWYMPKEAVTHPATSASH